MSKIEVNAIEPQCGTNLTVGASGDTITFPSGTTVVNNGSQTGFGRTGTVDWDTTAKTASFTAVSGNGYFVNTTSGAITVTLPAGSAGSIVSLKDYANTWQTNNVTVTPNGTDKINGENASAILNTQDQSVTLVYVDSTKGWRVVQDSTSDVTGAKYIVATGGTITCCGDYKIHTFTGPGTFTVCSVGNPIGSTSVDYLVVAGGGGAGGATPVSVLTGGGGAGGYRESSGTASGCYTISPLGACVSALPVSATTYPVTVGGGGAGGGPGAVIGNQGSNSVFSTITSTGGGYGAVFTPGTGGNGGSGGGGGPDCSGPGGAGGSGNTPPVSPPQGNNGGNGFLAPAPSNFRSGGGGGGATGAGGNGVSTIGGNGGAGATSSINATPTARAGGGGGAGCSSGGTATAGGGDGATGQSVAGCAGTANTGGGGGGSGVYTGPSQAGGSGGSGIVIIRYKYQN